jgi:hypothetical protein
MLAASHIWRELGLEATFDLLVRGHSDDENRLVHGAKK